MCGIVFELIRRPAAIDGAGGGGHTDRAETSWWMRRRGPDASGRRVFCRRLSRGEEERGGEMWEMRFAASVLQLRGEERVTGESLPLTLHTPALSSSSADDDDDGGGDDSALPHVLLFNGEVYEGLEDAAVEGNDAAALLRALAHASNVPALVTRLRGPWTFVYYDPRADCLWYGRDAIGRRSLLMFQQPPHTVSVDDVDDGLFCGFALASVACEADGWEEVPPGLHCFVFATGEHEHHDWKDAGSSESAALLRRIRRQERADVPLDTGVGPEQRQRAAEGCVAPELPVYAHRSPRDFTPLGVYVSAALAALDAAVGARVRALRRAGRTGDAPFAVGFSGGVDSCILVALLDRHLEAEYAIDLPTVSFAGEDAPDRVNARLGLAELRRALPNRHLRLICIDATQEDADAVQPRVRELLAPANTYMDMNIGTALWFAARAEGHIDADADGDTDASSEDARSTQLSRVYRSPAKVVFLGTGIDEQCAGYGRHFSRFRDDGWRALQEELSLDVERLWRRNLGRDDRLVADHGREARHPFLDEAFMDELISLPLHVIADLRMPRGVGDKRIIREMAVLLGLPDAARRVKRAIQFGTRLAKLSNRRDFGSNRRANLSHAGSCTIDPL